MDIPNTEKFRSELQAIIDKVASEPVELVFVDDVAAWCAQRKGQDVGNPSAKAIRDSGTRQAGILIRRHLDPDRVNEIKGRLDAGGYWIETSQLDTPKMFVTHLVLHELAHLLNNWGQDKEDECDALAFGQMGG